MALPQIKDQEIMEAIKTRFLAITAGADYYTTLAGKVFDNKSTPFDANNLIEINLVDGNEDLLEEQDSAEVYHDLSLDVAIEITLARTAVDNRRKIKADILKSIGTDITWGDLAITTEFLNAENDPTDQMGNKVADLRINISISYRKNAWSNNG